MKTEHLPLRIWMEERHRETLLAFPPPAFLSESNLFAACELLASYIIHHLQSLEVGLCVFEACRRPYDTEKKALTRQTHAWRGRYILNDLVAANHAAEHPKSRMRGASRRLLVT